MPWQSFTLSAADDREPLTVFTTAPLTWRPLVPGEPDGARIATLWGDPAAGAFAAVVQSPAHPPDVYTLIRRESA